MVRRRDGFTLIELMVVVVIIGILGVVALNTFLGKGEKAKWETTKAIVSKVANAITMFKMDHGKFPQKPEDLIRQPSYVDPKKWDPDGYLSKEDELNDGWGRPLIYRQPGTNGASFDVVSLGSDGEPAGEGVNEDIWNHDKYK